jgi:hypothetical protein
MYCIFKVIQNVMNDFEGVPKKRLPKRTSKSEVDFLFNSMSDETFLDLIREKIEFLIDEGYKYSEQLEIINRDSGRNIQYSTYTRFVKMYVMEDPQNLFQMREFHKYYSGYAPLQAPQPVPTTTVINKIVEEEAKPKIEKPKVEEEQPVPEPEETAGLSLREKMKLAKKKSAKIEKVADDEPVKKTKVEPLKKPDLKVETRGPLYKHEAMPNKDELY